MRRHDFPILEFDETREAVIEPTRVIKRQDVPDHCVLCFFQDVIGHLLERYGAREIAHSVSEDGRHPVYEIDYGGKRVAVLHPGIGAPLAAGLLEEMIARGSSKFIACGSAGVLRKDIAAGHLVLPTSAVRDEGTSYHYSPPGREAHPSSRAVTELKRVLERHAIAYVGGKTWTTDAFYRETAERVAVRRAEGCLTVEMEAAALFSVAKFRDVLLGQILWGGDDLSGTVWDGRYEVRPVNTREAVFWLAAEACLSM